MLFFLVDDIKSNGNDAYHKGDFYQALDYYEQVIYYIIWNNLNSVSLCTIGLNWKMKKVKDRS